MADIKDDATSLLSKPWRNFFDKFAEIDQLKNSKWKEIHQLAYICRRYEQYYGRKFSFSLKNAPSKCPEIVLVKKMCAMLGTTNARTIREYIDWIFDEKIIPKDMKIRSLAFFMTPGLGNEFFIKRVEKNKIDKTTELPNEYKEVVDSLGLPVSTYGDLAFAKCALEEAPNSESRAPYRQLFDKLAAMGFDSMVLNGLR
ncbi:MAG TPA: hypothetical protein VM577_20780 [Anaerovoracaceae bacterium]|nr:hypothetical protein [Anaerovoracaceae bacterium]